MATSADKLCKIIELACNLSREGKDNETVMLELAKLELLPKKLLPKEKKEVVVSMYASKQAEAAAVQAQLSLEPGDGTGKDGRYTLSDVKKHLEGPKLKPTSISPSALQLANENSISISGIEGTGKEGRIVLKDIQDLLDTLKGTPSDEISISPGGLEKLLEAGFTKSDLSGVIGSGKEGRILQKDVEEFILTKKEPESDATSEDEED